MDVRVDVEQVAIHRVKEVATGHAQVHVIIHAKVQDINCSSM